MAKIIVAGGMASGKTYFIKNQVLPKLDKEYFIFDLFDQYGDICPKCKYVPSDEMCKKENRGVLLNCFYQIKTECESAGKVLILDPCYFLTVENVYTLFSIESLYLILVVDSYSRLTFFMDRADTVYYMGFHVEAVKPDFYIYRSLNPSKFVYIDNYLDLQKRKAK